MNVEETIIGYLKDVNPAVISRAPDPNALKLRRVLDSLDMAEFISHLESSFRIKVTDRDVLDRKFETIGSVVAFVAGKIDQT